MSLLLTVIFAGALIYLWRKFDALEAQIQHLDQALDGLQFQLSREVQPAAAEAVSEQAPGSKPAPPQPSDPVDAPPQTEVEAEVEPEAEIQATAAPKAIPARRLDSAERLAAKPLEAEPTEPESDEPEICYEEPETSGFSFDVEDFFGRLLPIWAGGIALAVAGFFLVRYSIEQGWLGPQVRVALGFLFGSALLGGAEIAYRQEHRIADPRVRQALSGAGLATLYASFYFAGSQYGLIASAVAFLGLAGVTGAAITLSFRFGLPSAILALVGGFAAPLLVTSESPNLPLLALYLALVTSGLTYAGNRQGRSWLALGALAGGLGWGVLMLLSGVTGYASILAFGAYIVVLGAILPVFAKVDSEEGFESSLVLRLVAAALAAIQMGVMIGQAGFSLLAWGFYALLAGALAFFAWREPRLREASAFAAALSLVMVGIWPDPSIQEFLIVGGALTAIFGAVPLANIWRGMHRKFDTYQLTGFALGLIAVSIETLYWEVSDLVLAGMVLAISALPVLASWKQWPAREDPVVIDTLMAVLAAAIGITLAGLIAAPLWAAPLVIGSVALGLIALGWHREERDLTALSWATSIFAVLSMAATTASAAEFGLLFGIEGDIDIARALLRWTATSLPFIALALKKAGSQENKGAQAIAALLIYGIFAQVVPADALAWTTAGLSIIACFITFNAISARLTLGLVVFAWSLEPLLIWGVNGLAAAGAAQPMMIANAIDLSEIGLRILPVLAVAVSLLLRPAEGLREVPAAIAVPAGLVAAIAAHIGFKHIFALETAQQFAALGMAERTLWQALLFAGGLGVAKLFAEKSWSRSVSMALFAGALGHFALFTMFWHNPLWSEQAVGSISLLNLLLPAYGVAIGATIMLKRWLTSRYELANWPFDAALMGLISFLAFSELRHLFAGTNISDSVVGSTEDLLRSVLGILLAIGFLMWGARAHSRSWRVGSLVPMLAAVLKVFILDASGLDGLLRVASFIALGLSLIGIGWFYTRQLAGMRRLT